MSTKFLLVLAVVVVLGCLVDLADDGFLGRGDPFDGSRTTQLANSGAARLGPAPVAGQSQRAARPDPDPAPSSVPARC